MQHFAAMTRLSRDAPSDEPSFESSSRSMNSAVIRPSFSSAKTPCEEHRGIISKSVGWRLRLTRMAVNFLSAGQYRPFLRKMMTQIVVEGPMT